LRDLAAQGGDRPIAPRAVLTGSTELQSRLHWERPTGATYYYPKLSRPTRGSCWLVSMATSSGDDLPRNIEFLYSRNRLNVAISRARCPAVIFANPRLLEISCSTIAQMELVNGLCWARRFAVAQTAGAEDPTA
jgi:hypothetical protein